MARVVRSIVVVFACVGCVRAQGADATHEYKPNNALGIKSSGEHIGFSAQAVEKIVPEAVTKNNKGYLLVNNDPILWTMLNAIKKQQQTIERLQQENHKLNARNAGTEARLTIVETTMKRTARKNRRPTGLR